MSLGEDLGENHTTNEPSQAKNEIQICSRNFERGINERIGRKRLAIEDNRGYTQRNKVK